MRENFAGDGQQGDSSVVMTVMSAAFPFVKWEYYNRNIKTAKQRTIIQQHGDWYTGIVDGWAVLVTFDTSRRGLGGLRPRLGPCYTKCNSPSINDQCTNFILFNVAL